MWATLGFGPTADIDDSASQFKLIQTFGYHFWGTFEGPAVAVDLQEGFGDDWFSFALMPKFVWDIQIVENLGLYISPYAALGLIYASVDRLLVEYDGAGIAFQFGAEGRLILDGRWLVFARPLGFEIHGIHFDYPLVDDDWETGARYDFMIGGGATF
jgi:hypothetical protein